ncbi:glycoside hydrolase family 26 protein [Mesorhizobium sangaii]|uniref:Beta-mannanase n=1 Tax=Mesorhizobium sangaii TaxID=505389 RepID=A0A841NYF6_9HYPH|nr:glycoside hydrolase family 26 protein [Mesorhizobium sangaii]MBB6408006.1 beta-mannanase [Mesorhizobium sangaii]
MKHTTANALAIALVLGASAAFPTAGGAGSVATTDPVQTSSAASAFGSYDPYGDFSADKSASIEELFLPWEDVDLASLPLADAYALQRNRSLLITIEPWTWSKDWRITPPELRNGILSGKYDANMRAICNLVGAMKSPVTIRWAQEMEDKNGRFTWANWAPKDWIAAYKREVDICRKAAPAAKYMWSPKGEEGLEKYYPGDDYVDVIGLSVFGLQKKDNNETGHDRTFAEALKPGYDRVAGFNKPVVVAELGYVGKQEYVSKWEIDSRKSYSEFPALTSVVYFNQKEVWPWLGDYGLPDWRVTQHILP